MNNSPDRNGRSLGPDARQDLFSVVRLLSILGTKEYKFRVRSADSHTKQLRWEWLVSSFLVLPAIIQIASSLFRGHLPLIFFSEIAKNVAEFLAGAGVVTATRGIASARSEAGTREPLPNISVEREANVVRGALLLKQLVPEATAEAISKRVKECWDKYNDLLAGDHLPDEVEKGTSRLMLCICREVIRLAEINGGELPESAGILNDYQARYDCWNRVQRKV